MATIPEVQSYPVKDWRNQIINEVKKNARISALFGAEGGNLYAVISHDIEGRLSIATTSIDGSDKTYPSLSAELPQAEPFEREIAEQLGITPKGHPRLKPIRRTKNMRDFYQVRGHEVHEVAVGPVHAGIIESGHFRFQCHGELVFNLEVVLGYQHRGIERALIGGPDPRTLHYMETAAGDTTIGHATAYCQNIESLHGIKIPERAEVIRSIALELERTANHVGDLGALANDIGYLPTASFCGRLRGDFLNLTAQICGSRMGRGLVIPGGVAFDLSREMALSFQQKIATLLKSTKEATALLWVSPSVLSRFEHVGTISQKTAADLGLVGPAARASGLKHDVRVNYPTAAYEKFTSVSHPGGDVFARAYVRWLEIQSSVKLLIDQLLVLPETPIQNKNPNNQHLPPNRMAVSMVEGWRGEICHVAMTDRDGRFSRYKIVDPSFHNWAGLEVALKNQQISNFPLCNKSFNLSYCGHDL
ncbi:MAG: NADH-quinone oxidoreductase subunit C [Bdellovibrionota bacterium]